MHIPTASNNNEDDDNGLSNNIVDSVTWLLVLQQAQIFDFYGEILVPFKPIFYDCTKDIGYCIDEMDVCFMKESGANLSFDKSILTFIFSKHAY